MAWINRSISPEHYALSQEVWSSPAIWKQLATTDVSVNSALSKQVLSDQLVRSPYMCPASTMFSLYVASAHVRTRKAPVSYFAGTCKSLMPAIIISYNIHYAGQTYAPETLSWFCYPEPLSTAFFRPVQSGNTCEKPILCKAPPPRPEGPERPCCNIMNVVTTHCHCCREKKA